MELYSALSLLVVLAAAFAYVNHRYMRLPTTIGLMVLGLASSLLVVGLGRLGVVPILDLGKLVRSLDFSELLMEVMLGFLLFAGALHTDVRSLGQERGAVASLALVGTVLSTLLVAGAMYKLLPLVGLGLPFIDCLLFGALISPTDPIAVLGILRQARIPPQLEIRVVGESLFNDGVGVVIFMSLLQVAHQGADSLSASDMAGLFAREAVGGVLLGAGLGFAGYWLLRSIDQYQVEVLITLALVMGGTALAGGLHTSGPLAMVVAGLIIGTKGRAKGMSDVTREYLDKFWELVDEVLNALLFVLIGLEMLVLHFERLYLAVGLGVVLVVLAIRALSVGLPLALLRPQQRYGLKGLAVLTWGGLRGGISVALALSLPTALASRDMLIGITYVVVVFSILVQGLSIGKLVQRLGLAGQGPASDGHH
ncbi:sodium:proton antiporter [Hymenobacter saemangeumensis]|uniref:Sodium:proton antiporter n=1 Tax=Hymenobacter saemangeumensis TaxID=1084522 RepID=A0ABP8IM57_9BACT